MREQDYREKIECYEKCYGEKIDDPFTLRDIVGWVGGDPTQPAPTSLTDALSEQEVKQAEQDIKDQEGRS